MNKVNYQKELDKVLARIAADGKIPRLLLHSCCAPCSSYVLEYLSAYFAITVFYYNPNITEETEYRRRVTEQQRLIRELPARNPIDFSEGEYLPECFFEAVRGLEREPEGGKRCGQCFRLRLAEAGRMAAAGGFDYFTTTLSISPLKDAELLNTIGDAVAAECGVPYLHSDFKKKNGYLRSIELSREYDLYRQDYCGCIFSKEERSRQTK